mmetsp:Transcript_49545/g.97563  ORF Transcript_49545/g.97563 Transcript_49545/m.97563 type:complete len:253 (-) Transcript_49545:540-1298(-)
MRCPHPLPAGPYCAGRLSVFPAWSASQRIALPSCPSCLPPSKSRAEFHSLPACGTRRLSLRLPPHRLHHRNLEARCSSAQGSAEAGERATCPVGCLHHPLPFGRSVCTDTRGVLTTRPQKTDPKLRTSRCRTSVDVVSEGLPVPLPLLTETIHCQRTRRVCPCLPRFLLGFQSPPRLAAPLLQGSRSFPPALLPPPLKSPLHLLLPPLMALRAPLKGQERGERRWDPVPLPSPSLAGNRLPSPLHPQARQQQ